MVNTLKVILNNLPEYMASGTQIKNKSEHESDTHYNQWYDSQLK